MMHSDETEDTQRPRHPGGSSASLALRLQIVATAIVILGSIGGVAAWTTGIMSTWFNNEIDARIEEKLKDPLDDISRLNGRINEMPSWLEFEFKVALLHEGVEDS